MADTRSDPPTARSALPLLALAGAAGVATAFVVWAIVRAPEPEAVPGPAPRSSKAAAETPPPQPSTQPPAIESGQTLALSASSLATARPLVVDLLFPEPSTGTGPLPVRVLAPDGRILEIEAKVGGEDRRRASIEIESSWLSPGRYIVELKTTERTHLPLRRYVIEVQ